MANLVGGFLMPHVPLITAAKDMAPPDQAKVVYDAFGSIAQRLRELKADTAIIIGDDHYTLFGPHCIPRCLIGIGDVEGPIEPWLGIPQGPIANNAPLARHIMERGFDDGIDWSFASSLTVDHAVGIPYHLVVREVPGVRTIPVYLNAGVAPVISSRRAYQIGQSIGRAVQSWKGDERVVIFGTGGISHWVGAAQMGRVNPDYDQKILAMAAQGDVDGLMALPDAEILSEAGNGCLEIKNWLCAMGALPGAKAELIAYQALNAWITGLGFAELKKAA